MQVCAQACSGRAYTGSVELDRVRLVRLSATVSAVPVRMGVLIYKIKSAVLSGSFKRTSLPLDKGRAPRAAPACLQRTGAQARLPVAAPDSDLVECPHPQAASCCEYRPPVQQSGDVDMEQRKSHPVPITADVSRSLEVIRRLQVSRCPLQLLSGPWLTARRRTEWYMASKMFAKTPVQRTEPTLQDLPAGAVERFITALSICVHLPPRVANRGPCGRPGETLALQRTLNTAPSTVNLKAGR